MKLPCSEQNPSSKRSWRPRFHPDGADGDLEIQVSNTAEIVTIFIDLGDQNAVERIASSRWLDCDHATRIRCIVLRPEVEQLQGIMHNQKTNGWPADTAIP